jgi:hypothetical protein
MQFLWCGFYLSHEERQQDPFGSPMLLPCATIECALFREEAPLCDYLVREGPGKRIIKLIEEDGGYLIATKGSHRPFKHPENRKNYYCRTPERRRSSRNIE